MVNGIMTFLTKDELLELIIQSMRIYEAEKAATISVEQTFSINEVAKRLHRSHATIKGFICDNVLETTSDKRRIKAQSLNEYLNSKTR
jgi:transposase